jgi:dsDNA-specific endonuclease/ATPase MutS2
LRAYAGRGERRASLQLTVEDHEIDAFNPFPDPMRLEIGDVFDLHAFRPREVQRVVEEYLSEAHKAGFSVVRIVHGKGKGVQREIVRAVLARTPFVSDWMDAPPEAGGWGATIARFSPKEHVSKNSARAS